MSCQKIKKCNRIVDAFCQGCREGLLECLRERFGRDVMPPEPHNPAAWLLSKRRADVSISEKYAALCKNIEVTRFSSDPATTCTGPKIDRGPTVTFLSKNDVVPLAIAI